MKFKKLHEKGLAAVLGVMLALFGTLGVFAEDMEPVLDDEPQVTEYAEPETEYVEPETQYIEPETEYTEPETTEEQEQTEPAEEPTDEQTEPAAEETTGYVGYVDETQPEETEFVPPTIPKTVSEKTYSTNYTAGIISWACVIVGIIVVTAALVSTKVSGRRASRRRI